MQRKYITLPINDSCDRKHYFLRTVSDCGKTVVNDFDAAVCTDDTCPNKPRFDAYIDITRFGDAELELTDADGNAVEYGVTDNFPTRIDYLRPAVHYTSTIGWNNDPNGLIFVGGKYHMFYQHNPMGWNWGNMTWGHAVSYDMVHWNEIGDELFPDNLGTMFSGSAVCDYNNVSGLGKGAILLYYTAAGGCSRMSDGVPFSQCLAYSTDGGETFTKYEKNPIIPHIIGGNRDPKVQWSDELGKFTLSLYLDGNDYAIFTSDNLLDWTKLTDVHTPSDNECPDFYPLPVEGTDGNADSETKWVFSGAHDTYIIGSLDENGFHLEQDELPYHIGPGVSYAAQTFSGTGDRRIKIAWGQNSAPGATFNSQMSIPMEMFLRRVNGTVRLGSLPVRETERLRIGPAIADVKNVKYPLSVPVASFSECATDVRVELTKGHGKLTVSCYGMDVCVDADANTYTHGDCTAPLSYDGKTVIRIIFDKLGLEVFADDGLVYSTMGKIAESYLGLSITPEGSDTEYSVTAYALKM